MGGILVVEDDEAFLACPMRVALRGRQLFEAHNFPQALEILEQKPEIDGALIDLDIPGGSGLEILVVVREAYPDALSAIFSAHSIEKLMIKAQLLGGLYLVKENSMEVLRGYLTLLDARRQASLDAAISDFGLLHELSPRELDIVRLVTLDLERVEITKVLGISENTLKSECANIFQKTGNHNLQDIGRAIRRSAQATSRNLAIRRQLAG